MHTGHRSRHCLWQQGVTEWKRLGRGGEEEGGDMLIYNIYLDENLKS